MSQPGAGRAGGGGNALPAPPGLAPAGNSALDDCCQPATRAVGWYGGRDDSTGGGAYRARPSDAGVMTTGRQRHPDRADPADARSAYLVDRSYPHPSGWQQRSDRDRAAYRQAGCRRPGCRRRVMLCWRAGCRWNVHRVVSAGGQQRNAAVRACPLFRTGAVAVTTPRGRDIIVLDPDRFSTVTLVSRNRRHNGGLLRNCLDSDRCQIAEDGSWLARRIAASVLGNTCQEIQRRQTRSRPARWHRSRSRQFLTPSR